MQELPSKHELKAELEQWLRSELETAEEAQRRTVEGATHEEAKPENDKDTRALEQTYLARGQAVRVKELRDGVAHVRDLAVPALPGDAAIVAGALVAVHLDDEPAFMFVSPYGGGTRLAGGRVLVVTPGSPLGRALAGKRAGDSCEVVVQGRTREVSILGVT